MSVPKDYRYTDTHEWAKFEEDHVVSVGLTEYAQDKLGDIVSVELPRMGDEVEKGEPVGMVDSQKASSEMIAPVSGVVMEVNELLDDDPAVINSDPYDEGWFIRIEIEEVEQMDELMSADDYEEMLGQLDEED